MQNLVYSLLGLVLWVVLPCQGQRIISECQVLHELRRNGFPEVELRDWLCLINRESGRQTDKIGPINPDGSRDWGIFQINDRYWCSTTSEPGKECNVTCDELIADDISTAARCAKKIFGVHTFSAWHAWMAHCTKFLPHLPFC